jgi:hypothetical protein
LQENAFPDQERLETEIQQEDQEKKGGPRREVGGSTGSGIGARAAGSKMQIFSTK